MALKIIELYAENVKRLRVVHVRLDGDGNLIVVSGRNGQGKTSLLDAVALALAGGEASKLTPRPIRDGEDHAEVTVTLGTAPDETTYTITRRWTEKGSTLVVEGADGFRAQSPQRLLDGLLGHLAFDPLAFAEQPAKEQVETLLRVIDLPFDLVDLDAQRAAAFETRTEVGRDVKALEAQLAATPEPPSDLPGEEVSVGDLLTGYREAQDAHTRYDAVERERTRLENEVERLRADLDRAERALADLPSADSPANLPDLVAAEARIANIEQINTAVRAAAQRGELAARLAARQAEQTDLTEGLAALDRVKATALAAAAMPVAGLGFDDDGVTYNGVPFRQVSGAERLRISVAIAIALNPRLRIMLIRDGSLLDGDNLALLAAAAQEHDAQIWIERVGDGGSIHIEDGALAEPPPAGKGDTA